MFRPAPKKRDSCLRSITLSNLFCVLKNKAVIHPKTTTAGGSTGKERDNENVSFINITSSRVRVKKIQVFPLSYILS